MNKTIWKFPLLVANFQQVEMPTDAEILTVQLQGEVTLCLWALVDPLAEKQKRGIWIHGTGHPIEYYEKRHGRYINTFQLNHGTLVFHVFEGKP